ncbi:MAG: hypothetical protein JJU00_04520 [Opitutales bacterium]|nr:hypothetical protein [Opitutales bacterium]
MWIFTRHGFFSIAHRPEMDAEHPVQIRARCREDLEALRGRWGALLGARPVIDTPQGDYPARMCVTGETFEALLRETARDLDYGNFKGEIGRTPGQADKLRAYHDIWGTMADYQRRKTGRGPYGAG